jgi:hypothetical protein
MYQYLLSIDRVCLLATQDLDRLHKKKNQGEKRDEKERHNTTRQDSRIVAQHNRTLDKTKQDKTSVDKTQVTG